MRRTQQGNNNAYCQDNSISWVNWDLQQEDLELLDFVHFLIHLRKLHPIFRRRNFFQGCSLTGSEIKAIIWLNPNGQEMNQEAWKQAYIRCLGVYLSGQALDERDQYNQPVLENDFLLLLNAQKSYIYIESNDKGGLTPANVQNNHGDNSR